MVCAPSSGKLTPWYIRMSRSTSLASVKLTVVIAVPEAVVCNGRRAGEADAVSSHPTSNAGETAAVPVDGNHSRVPRPNSSGLEGCQ